MKCENCGYEGGPYDDWCKMCNTSGKKEVEE